MTDDIRFKIPESGLTGLKALIGLGPEGVSALCELVRDLPLTLNMRGLTSRLANELKVETRAVSQFVMGALMPLNHLRVHLKLETPDFLKVLSENLEKEASEKWRSENLPGWKAIEGRVAPLFEKDNFFSVSNKSYQMLVNRPNPVQDVKILSELRPVYSEDATSVKGFVLVKMLVVDYLEGETKKIIHLSMDMDDLRSLALEVDRAKLERETISEEVFGWGVDLIDRALGRRAGILPAIALLESIVGRKARCLVQVAGSELPVDLPVRLFDARGLKPGDRFLWWMSEDGSVAAEDIDDLPPNRLTDAEEEEGQRLYQELCEDIASGDAWGLSAGQGR